MENAAHTLENPTAEEDLKGSKDPGDFGDNGNPAQSAGRVTAQEQDESPASLEIDPVENYPDMSPDSLSRHEREHSHAARRNGGTEAESIEGTRN